METLHLEKNDTSTYREEEQAGDTSEFLTKKTRKENSSLFGFHFGVLLSKVK